MNFINEAVIGRSTFGIAGKVTDDSLDINIIVANGRVCEDYLTEEECPETCYWYDDACHSKPKDEEIPWAVILAVAGGIIAIIVGIAVAARR